MHVLVSNRRPAMCPGRLAGRRDGRGHTTVTEKRTYKNSIEPTSRSSLCPLLSHQHESMNPSASLWFWVFCTVFSLWMTPSFLFFESCHRAEEFVTHLPTFPRKCPLVHTPIGPIRLWDRAIRGVSLPRWSERQVCALLTFLSMCVWSVCVLCGSAQPGRGLVCRSRNLPYRLPPRDVPSRTSSRRPPSQPVSP